MGPMGFAPKLPIGRSWPWSWRWAAGWRNYRDNDRNIKQNLMLHRMTSSANVAELGGGTTLK